MAQTSPIRASTAESDARHGRRVEWLEKTAGDVLALSDVYPDGHRVPQHRHSRCQLLHARSGVVLVATGQGRWMVPPGHAMWIPSGVDHSVDMLGTVRMQSVYVNPAVTSGTPNGLRVVALTDLMRSLIAEAAERAPDTAPDERDELVMGLIVKEIPRLRELPLGLPLPADPKLARLCRAFVERPSPQATIDSWASAAGMSRRSFTRAFQRETGLSLSVWRQQACLFAALPRLAEGVPVTGVALDLGYESVPAFTTMFRRMLGAAPRDYFRNADAGRENA
ncbi:helix-turn-helix transcriptional regulator [Aquibium sp. LZ166]|uniref:Helix-turn-helix transcriptional regulator n=1 Tax=Aquibium pacificus TaxID=3153579 RepID=A0ABV3SEI9_9HYPH